MTDATHWVGSRQLLRRLRDAMARGGTAQERLDRIPQIIARGMVAEVCSVYVMRPGEMLVLFSTEGLRKDAVFRTRLRVGEGLVGAIAANARSLALADAQSHPQFAYRPETGEEIYHSFLGVPVLRAGRVLGVLTVQNQTQRNYTEEEIETLETVAMVVAELIAGAELSLPDEPFAAVARPVRLEGTCINGGLAKGVVMLHERGAPITQTIAESPELELERLARALSRLHLALDTMVDRFADKTEGDGRGESLDVLRTFRMIADDHGWIGRMREAVQSGLTAEAAVAKVQNDTRARMSQISDPYLRDRLMDLDDLAYRLLQHLTEGKPGASSVQPPLPGDVVLVARSMGPAELLDYDASKLRALILDEGTATSHVAIVAKALNIPVVGNVQGVIGKVEPNDPILVDGDHGMAYVRPTEDLHRSFEESLRFLEQKRAKYAKTRNLPAVTKDGVSVSLLINAGLLIDLQRLREIDADGVGLYRTEIPFMIRSQFPRLDAQTALYGEIYERAAGKPIVFRTLDIGGDKLLPYLRGTQDQNPAMGWRAIRMALDRPAILRLQLRALIRAAAGRELRVMFPLVAEATEFDAARTLVDRELDRAQARGDAVPERVLIGAMLEVPSLYFQLPHLLRRVDFLSVGSNDLVQFLFACDRGNPRVSDRYDTLSPIVLSFLSGVARYCREAKVPVSLCGELAGEPLGAMTLLGLGFRSLSMPPGAIDAIRHMVRHLDLSRLERHLDEVIDEPGHSLRERLQAFAEQEGIEF